MVRKTNQKTKDYKKFCFNRKNQNPNRLLKKKALTFFPVCLCTLLFTFFLSIPLKVESQIVERIVTIVNDSAITQTDIDNLKKRIQSDLFTDDFLFLYEENPKTLLKNQKKLIQYLIQKKILESKIIENNLTASQASVDKAINNILLRGNFSEKQLQTFLNQKGFTLSEYREFIEDSIKQSKLIEKEILSKIKISDEDIASYYRKQNSKEKTPHIFKYTLSHIFIPKSLASLKRNSSKIKNPSQKKASLIYQELTKNKELQNTSLERLATQYSEKNLPLTGGPIGTFSISEINPLFKKTVLQLKTSEISKPIETKTGYYLLKLDKRTLVANPDLKKERQKIRSILHNEKFHQTLHSWLEEEQKKAFIYKNDLASTLNKKSTKPLTKPLKKKM